MLDICLFVRTSQRLGFGNWAYGAKGRNSRGFAVVAPAQRLAVGEQLCIVARAQKLLDRLLCFPLFALEDHGYQQGWGCVGASSESLGYFDCQVRRQDVFTRIHCKGRGLPSRDHILAFAAPRCYLWGKSGGTDVNVINGKELHRKLHRDDGGFHLWGRWRPSFYHWRFDKGCWSVRVRRWLGRRGCRHSSSGSPQKSENVARQQPATRADLRRLWKKHNGTGVLEIENYGAETNQNNAHRGELHVGAFLVNTAPDRRPHGKLPRPGACRYIIPCTDKLPVCHRYTPVLQAKRRKAAEVVEAPKVYTSFPTAPWPWQEDGSKEEPLSGLYSDPASDVSGSVITLFLFTYIYVCICFEW